MKSADSRSASLPVGAQCDSLIPISWPWNTGRPWCPLWVISAMAGPGRSSRNTSNALRFVFGPSRWSVSGLDDPLHLRLDPLALRANLGEPCREDDGELRPGRYRVAEDGKRVSDEDGDEIELLVDVGQRLHRRAPGHDGAVRVHVVHGGAAGFGPGGDLHGQSRVRPGVGVGRPDDRHPLRTEERVEVDVAQRGRTAGDVERRVRPRHLPPSLAPSPPRPVGPLLRRPAAKQHASERGLHGR